MTLDIKNNFTPIYNAFLNDTHTLQDVSQIITLIRHYGDYIPDETKIELLQIPLNVLKTQTKLQSPKSFAKNNGSYFSGNMLHLEPHSSKFESGNFSLDDITILLENIMSNSSMLNNDFYLRNPEVTLRDHVKLINMKEFKACGTLYAKIIEKLF